MCLAVPGRVLNVAEVDGTQMAEVDFGGVHKDVCLQYIPDVAVGDYVIVHVGFAISKVQEDEARRTYETLREMSQLDELDWMRETADFGLAAFAGPESTNLPSQRGGDA